MRAEANGHQVRYCLGDYNSQKSPVGRGLVERVPDWRGSIRWADLVILGGNDWCMQEFAAWRERGVPIIGGTPESAAWESDRALGMQVFKKAGIPVPPFRGFSDYNDAIAYVKRQGRAFVSKPSGKCDDKGLSYVPKSPEALRWKLDRWRRSGKRAGLEFILQEKLNGIEFACGAWFGPGGFAEGVELNWEFKKIGAGDIGINCYSADTDVLTEVGWKPWPDVGPQDRLATLVDGEMVYEKPIRLIAHHHSGEMIGWQSNRVDLLVTPDHAMWVVDRQSVRKGEPEFFRMPADDVAADQRQNGFSVRRTCDWRGGRDTGISPEKARLLGMFMADGNLKKRSLQFGNCPAHKEPLIREAALAAGYQAHRYGKDIYINSKVLADEWSWVPYGPEKYAPPEIMNAQPHIMAAFLDGLSLDATITRGALVYTTASRQMADDIQVMAIKTGRVARIKERDRRSEPDRFLNGYVIRGSLSWDVGVSSQSLAKLRHRDCRRISYDDMVYCATVSSGVIMVRRNGKACWNGQCGEAGTVMAYVKRDKLADQVLYPLEEQLHRIGYIGNVDVNCIVDEDGTPWPLEFTMRCGWPAMNIEQELFETDFVEFLAGLAAGKPPKNAHKLGDVAVGVVLAIGDWPYSRKPPEEVVNVPLWGIDNRMMAHVHPAQMMAGEFEGAPCYATAGDYVLIAARAGETMRQARDAAYRIIDRIEVPETPYYRPDIGDRLSRQLPKLQEMGFAKDVVF